MIIDLPDELKLGLEARAESQGMKLEAFVSRVLSWFADKPYAKGGWVEDYECEV
jgi:hypothetical protein